MHLTSSWRWALIGALAASALGLSLPAGAASSPLRAARAVEPWQVTAQLAEPPTAVAVADTGRWIAALFDRGSLAFADNGGAVREIPVDCTPFDVDISPDGHTAWAACYDSGSLVIADLATATARKVDYDLSFPAGVLYSPLYDSVIVSDSENSALKVIAHDGTSRTIPVVGQPYNVSTLSRDGRKAFVAVTNRSIVELTIATGKTRTITLSDPQASIRSLSYSRNHAVLYAGVNVLSTPTDAVEVVDPATGKVLQTVPLGDGSGKLSAVSVSAGRSVLYVGDGMGTLVDGQLTGIVGLVINDDASLGTRLPESTTLVFPAALSLSADASLLAVGSTGAQLLLRPTDDPPPPASLTLTARRTPKGLALSGLAVSVPPGAQLTVHIRISGKSGFVVASTKATVLPDGTYRWAGTAPKKRLMVFVSADSVASPRRTVPAA